MHRFLFISLFVFTLFSCKKDPPVQHLVYDPKPYQITYPSHFDAPPINEPDNPLTQQGVALGRKLFYDPILSKDSSMSCASCHKQEFAFTDGNATSIGVDGIAGNRSAMSIVNLAYVNNGFFWDGAAASLTELSFEPVRNPIEMHLSWIDAVDRLQNHSVYPAEFFAAFGEDLIDSVQVAKALSQFMRIIISDDAKIDKALIQYNEYVNSLSPTDSALALEQFLLVANIEGFTAQEIQGAAIYNSEIGDCFHCHGLPRATDNEFRNNALDAIFTDLGRAEVTGNIADQGKFRSPTLRNIALTAPYMHDGRFDSLEEVLAHYSFELQQSPTVDPLMKKIDEQGLGLNNQEIQALKAFLLTFTDESFITNPEYSNPF